MHYELLGQAGGQPGAETVLLSSGLGGAGAFWQPQFDALSAKYRVITYDQRGTGRNTQPLPGPYAIGAMADDVAGIMDAAGVTRVHFAGHALGGLVGLELAARHPARVQSLVLVNAWAKADPHTLRCFALRKELLQHGGPESYVRAQPFFLYPAPWLSQNTERLDREHAHGVAHFQGADTLLKRIAALQAFDISSRLATITCPTLIAASRDDMLVPWTASQALADALPNARLWLVPEGGHAFTVTEPAAFNAELLAFLAGHPA